MFALFYSVGILLLLILLCGWSKTSWVNGEFVRASLCPFPLAMFPIVGFFGIPDTFISAVVVDSALPFTSTFLRCFAQPAVLGCSALSLRSSDRIFRLQVIPTIHSSSPFGERISSVPRFGSLPLTDRFRKRPFRWSANGRLHIHAAVRHTPYVLQLSRFPGAMGSEKRT